MMSANEQRFSDGVSGRKLALFLDFDGTLVELAERPELVAVPEHLPDLLERLSSRLDGALAIVTGRPLRDVDAFLTPLQLPTAAAHGSERRGAEGNLTGVQNGVLHAADAIADRLEPLVRSNPGLVLERKDGAVALHYRQAPALHIQCRAAMQSAIGDSEQFQLVEGKMVIEARPRGIDKGVAVEQFLGEAPFAGRLPVFIGDDRTDEDGFAAVSRLGGVAIKVGPGDTLAPYRLENAAAVLDLIAELAASDRPAMRLSDAVRSNNSEDWS